MKRFAPTPAELRELVGDTSPDDAALLAWADLLASVRIGPYATVQFRDPVITATIRSVWGNWPAVCDAFADGQSQEKWIEQRFSKAYKANARRTQIGIDETAPLGGLGTGRYSRETGKIEPPKPKLLGKLPNRPTPPLVTHDDLSALAAARLRLDDSC